MSNNYTGFTSDTPKRLKLDAGAFYKNFIYGSDTPATAQAKLLGATRGGGTFDAIPEMRQIPVDGVKGRAKGMTLIESWDAKMAVNLLEMTTASLALALAGASVDSTTETDYDVIKGKHQIDPADYLDNLTYVGKISGSSKPIIIQMFNVLNNNGLSIASEDKGESVIALELLSHYDVDQMDEPPFAIYYPKEIPTP